MSVFDVAVYYVVLGTLPRPCRELEPECWGRLNN